MKPELVLPGGDLERAKIAFDYGADAVYVGLNKYSLRKGEVRFNIAEIRKAIEYAHSLGKKLYVTFNIFAHNSHLSDLKKDMKAIANLKPDAFIIADLGIMQIAKRVASNVPVHVSTQANVTNSEQIRFYKKLGAKRVVLARELTLKEISEIHKAVPGVELEVFAHGSMCISYSGRCLLSNYMTGRHANLGDCAQPCRWNYDVYLSEKQRPGEYFSIEESDNGTNIMSSRDLCTVEYIDKMIKAGITGFKVEGRNKTEYYLAATALAYREAINLSACGKYTKKDKQRLKNDLKKLAHRGYTTGFLMGDANKGETYKGRSPIESWRYVGQIVKPFGDNSYQVVVKNKLSKNMHIEVLTPTGIKRDKIIEIMVDSMNTRVISPGKEDQTAKVTLEDAYPIGSLLRTKV
ncbi:MAG: U32 family peptidase [Patescibacteria group bacterium]|nr:U32 family peptidase [Patescibacteria group bacterium]